MREEQHTVHIIERVSYCIVVPFQGTPLNYHLIVFLQIILKFNSIK